MRPDYKFDVIIVGGGPGGSVAGKHCAEEGFKTLLLEKRKLPRDKVCSGLVMGPWAKKIIEKKFGKIPESVLAPPRYLSGHMFHVPGIPPKSLEWHTPIAWRKDLDYWLSEKARGVGVEIWEGTKAIGISKKGKTLEVICESEKNVIEIECKYLIGADGATSRIRKSIFPNLNIKYFAPVRECCKGALELEADYIHWFFPRLRPRPRFTVNHKGDYFLLEGSGIKELRADINKILVQYGFDTRSSPVWKDGCLEPLLHNELVSGSFAPAEGNVLLVGDAAGLIFPITCEGIGSALKSGMMAAEAIVEADRKNVEAAGTYLTKLDPVIRTIKDLLEVNKRLESESADGGKKFLEALRFAYEETFRIQ